MQKSLLLDLQDSHFAILLPDRGDLAATYLALRVWNAVRWIADHLVTESLYLLDPENNGIESYRERPSEEWPRDTEGHLVMGALPLNLQSLLSETNKGESNNKIPFPTGGINGHIHLRVTNLERSIKFYLEKLRLDMTADWTSMGVAFLLREDIVTTLQLTLCIVWMEMFIGKM
jgi:catechol 2,3-dioxygenase